MVIIIIALNMAGQLLFKFYFMNVLVTKNYATKCWEDERKSTYLERKCVKELNLFPFEEIMSYVKFFVSKTAISRSCFRNTEINNRSSQ